MIQSLVIRAQKAARWLAPLAVSAAVLGVGMVTGLWLGHRPPTVTLVPGTPVLVTLDGYQETREARFIARLLGDLNGRPPVVPVAGSCFADGGTTRHLQFLYANGDRLSIDVFYPCGASAVAVYAPMLMARLDQPLIDDLTNWPDR